ncbi:hypothetical protein Btru_071418 [Bulinus truncatus]|nr:hypothetical protein Btru_071418 [Bulinus truncatus]
MLVVARDVFPFSVDYQTLHHSGHQTVRHGVELATGRWSVTSELSSARIPADSYNRPQRDRSLSVVNGVEYVPTVSARGGYRLLRRRHSKNDVPPSAVLGTCAKIHLRRGLARTPLEDEHHPIEEIKESELVSKPYLQHIETAIRRYSPDSCGDTSSTINGAQSEVSQSHNGWTTGNTTERSSLDSSYCFDDYDRTTANTVSQHYENFESLLYEGESPRENLVQQADMMKECVEWCSQFPYFRVSGKQIVKENNSADEEDEEKKGYKLIQKQPAPSSSLLGLSDRENSFSSLDTQGLTLTGQKVSLKQVSVYDDFSSSGPYLVEEVIEEEGVYEDIIAVDYQNNNYEDYIENKKQITPRRRRVGYPPVTPIACVKDSVTSAAFDHIWQEIMSWLRPLLQRFSTEISGSKTEVITFSSSHPPPPQAQPSFILQTRQNSFHRSNTHIGGSTERSIDGILHISSIPLVHRVEMPESHAPSAVSTPPAPVKTTTGIRKVRLKPLVTQNRPQPVTQSSALLKVTGSTAINSEGVPSQPPSRHGTLPPLEIEPKKFQPGHRAASAIDNKDNRHLPNKDRPHLIAEQARPNTTHAMRYDSLFGAPSLRRSSTPLGNSFATRLHLTTNKSLDVRGSGLQHTDSIHFPPDIQEDQQESPAEESYRPHWTGPSASTHVSYGRNRLSLR